jgi:hypothetical protein
MTLRPVDVGGVARLVQAPHPLGGGLHEEAVLLLRAAQRLLGAAVGGDVDREHDDADDGARVVAVGHLVGAHPQPAARAVGVALEDAELRLAGADDLQVVGVQRGGQLGGEELLGGVALQLGGRAPHRRGGGGVGAQDAVVRVLVDDDGRHGVEDDLLLVLLLAQALVALEQLVARHLQRALHHGTVGVGLGVGGVDDGEERLERLGHLVEAAEVALELPLQEPVH